MVRCEPKFKLHSKCMVFMFSTLSQTSCPVLLRQKYLQMSSWLPQGLLCNRLVGENLGLYQLMISHSSWTKNPSPRSDHPAQSVTAFKYFNPMTCSWDFCTFVLIFPWPKVQKSSTKEISGACFRNRFRVFLKLLGKAL